MKKILLAAAVSAAFGISGVQAAEDITVDVAVIGAGGAGLSAAVEAANLGAKVVVVEKMAMAGGNTIRAAGGLNAPCTSLQAAKGVQDSLEIAYYDTMKGGHWKNDPELVRTLVAGAGPSVEWLLALGGDLRDVGLLAGASKARAHRPTGGALVGPEVVRTLYTAAKDRKIDMRMNTEATKILTDDGKVTGIQVKSKKDGTYTIHAKAVVNAAGGFGANNELNTRDAVSAAILKQKDGVAYLFFDSDMQKSLKATNNYIKQSYCLKGETLDELAGKMGVPADKLKASLEAWKQGKAAGKDAFGRADMPRNLDQAPFYAIMVTPAVHHTMGGVKIDPKTQVYNTKGQIIPGYFAAGEITGGVHGGNRLGGNAQADIVTFGRIAGQQAYIYSKQAK